MNHNRCLLNRIRQRCFRNRLLMNRIRYRSRMILVPSFPLHNFRFRMKKQLNLLHILNRIDWMHHRIPYRTGP